MLAALVDVDDRAGKVLADLTAAAARFDRYRVRGILPPQYYENIRRYVEEGGALLVSSGPEIASVESLNLSPLGAILPARPTGRIVEEAPTRAMLAAPREAYTRSLWAVRDFRPAPRTGETAPAPTGRLGRVGHVARTGRARALDRLATSKLPGTPRWQAMSPEERDQWWVSRVGRFTSAVAAVPARASACAEA